MSNLAIKENLTVASVEVPNISGGFGEGKKAMLAKHIAEIHGKKLFKVNEVINNNRQRFKDNIEIIDVKINDDFLILLTDNGILSQNSINRSENIYLLSERGYAKLVKMFDDDKSWELYDQLLDEYFELRDGNVVPMNNQPSTQLQVLQTVINNMVEHEQQMLAIQAKQEEYNKELKLIHNKQIEQESKVEQVLDYATAVPDFKTIHNAINKYSRLSSKSQLEVRGEVYKKISDIYGIDLTKRVNNAHKKIQNERINSGKNPYKQSSLNQKYSKMDVIREEKLEKEVIQILMDMTNELSK